MNWTYLLMILVLSSCASPHPRRISGDSSDSAEHKPSILARMAKGFAQGYNRGIAQHNTATVTPDSYGTRTLHCSSWDANGTIYTDCK